MKDNLVLTAGVARSEITPPVGFRMGGIVSRTEPSIGVKYPLLATVLVLADARTKIVIFDCDLIGLDLPLVGQIRRTVGERIGTPMSNVAVGCTHAHDAPSTVRGTLIGPSYLKSRQHEMEELDAYIEYLVVQLAGIAALADKRREPARAKSSQGIATIAINREEMCEDGRVRVGRNPDGPTDHTVDVLRVDDLNGNPIAVLTGYAAHPVVMGANNLLLGPDFPGMVRRIVEQVTGATCLYLTGAAGNQATLSFLQDDWKEVERTGGVIGCEAAKVFFDIETRPHEVVREFDASLSKLALYHKEFQDGPTHRVLKAASRSVLVPLQPLPTLETAQTYLDEARSELRKLEAGNAPDSLTYPALLAETWAKGVFDKVRAGVKQESLSFDIVGYRLDDFVLVGMPGEPFVEIGLGVKARSKAGHTMFAGYCNGAVAYWPTAETVKQGGMAVEAGVKTYNNSAPPVAETVDILVNHFDDLLTDLGS